MVHQPSSSVLCATTTSAIENGSIFSIQGQNSTSCPEKLHLHSKLLSGIVSKRGFSEGTTEHLAKSIGESINIVL
jgi:hypothetical protein